MGQVPRHQRYYQRTPTSRRPSRRASSPSLGGTTGVPCSLPRGWAAPGAGTHLYGGSPRAASPVETARPPRFLGDPSPACPALRPRWNRRRPASPGAPGVAFRTRHGVGFHDHDYFGAQSRGLQGSLCTLRSRGRPRTTQHSVPAGWPTLAGQVFHLLGRIEGFRHVTAWLPPSPSFAWRKTGTSARRQRPPSRGTRTSSSATDLARGRNADGDVRAPPGAAVSGCADVLVRNGPCTGPECGRGRPRTARVRRLGVRGRPHPQRTLHEAGMRTGRSAHRQGPPSRGARTSSSATDLARGRNADREVRAPPGAAVSGCADVLVRNGTLHGAGMRTGTSAHRQGPPSRGARTSSSATWTLHGAGMRTGTVPVRAPPGAAATSR